MNTAKIKGKTDSWFLPLKTTFSESRGLQVLSAVLVLQLLLAGGLLWRSSTQGEFAPPSQLVSFDPATVNEILIDDGDNKVTLTLSDEQWHMDDEHATIAASDKIEALITNLNDLNAGLPVASTKGSHAQLEVADDEYQRRLVLNAGTDTVVDLYLGTSPGFRKSHARIPGKDAVYAVKLNTFDVPAMKGDWLDNNLLAFNDVEGIISNDNELALDNDKWSLVKPQDQQSTHEIDSAAIDTLTATLTSLSVTDFTSPLEADENAGDSAEPNSESDEVAEESTPLITHELSVVQGDTPIKLTISRKGDDATIERSDVNGLFALPVSTFDALTPEAVQQVIVEKSQEDPAESDQPNG